MPDVTVTINLSNIEIKVLKHIAEKAGMTAVGYGNRLIRDFIRGQVKGYYRRKFNTSNELELMAAFGDLTATALSIMDG